MRAKMSVAAVSFVLACNKGAARMSRSKDGQILALLVVSGGIGAMELTVKCSGNPNSYNLSKSTAIHTKGLPNSFQNHFGSAIPPPKLPKMIPKTFRQGRPRDSVNNCSP